MSAQSAKEYAQDIAEGLRTLDVDVWEYLEGILDYQYTRNSQGDLVSVRLLVAFGGPTAWVTFDGDGALVECHWWSDVERVYVSGVPMSEIVLEYFEEAMLVS